MEKKAAQMFKTEFEADVFQGLTSSPKFLSSKYFYDKAGDKLFQEIMELPEYYLTNCEYEILDTHKNAIKDIFDSEEGFNVLDLGAGDGMKTKILLKHFLAEKLDFSYHPIDISTNALNQLSLSLKFEIPALKVFPKQGTYIEAIKSITSLGEQRNVILFLGSNIGNMTPSVATAFLRKLYDSMKRKDLLFIGFDLKKNPSVILDAYNDSKGITAAFNLNLLKRINNELQGDFNLDSFLHWPLYNPQSGEAKSFLVSKKEQVVRIENLNLNIIFSEGEGMQTEVSRKFDTSIIEAHAKESGFEISGYLSDKKDFFRNYIFQKK